MATEQNSSTTSREELAKPGPFSFGASASPIYSLAPDTNKADVIDQLNARLGQLEAMLSMTYGDPGQAFRTRNDTLQDDFMWSCGTLAQECRELFERLQ